MSRRVQYRDDDVDDRYLRYESGGGDYISGLSGREEEYVESGQPSRGHPLQQRGVLREPEYRVTRQQPPHVLQSRPQDRYRDRPPLETIRPREEPRRRDLDRGLPIRGSEVRSARLEEGDSGRYDEGDYSGYDERSSERHYEQERRRDFARQDQRHAEEQILQTRERTIGPPIRMSRQQDVYPVDSGRGSFMENHQIASRHEPSGRNPGEYDSDLGQQAEKIGREEFRHRSVKSQDTRRFPPGRMGERYREDYQREDDRSNLVPVEGQMGQRLTLREHGGLDRMEGAPAGRLDPRLQDRYQNEPVYEPSLRDRYPSGHQVVRRRPQTEEDDYSGSEQRVPRNVSGNLNYPGNALHQDYYNSGQQSDRTNRQGSTRVKRLDEQGQTREQPLGSVHQRVVERQEVQPMRGARQVEIEPAPATYVERRDMVNLPSGHNSNLKNVIMGHEILPAEPTMAPQNLRQVVSAAEDVVGMRHEVWNQG